MIRLGLCCMFREQPIKFRTATRSLGDSRSASDSPGSTICGPDGLTVEQATEQAIATWHREPLFHISSPIDGWRGPRPERHHDFIDVRDFPKCWLNLALTVEVEAKAKELAVLKLKKTLQRWRTPRQA
jgi:UV DNA damage repair endonuclease